MKHIGTVGAKQYVFVKCTKVKAFSSKFRHITTYTYMNFLIDRYGNHFVYKGSKSLIVGDYYGMTATVKLHQDYMGTLQTWLTRPNIDKHMDSQGVAIDKKVE